MAATELSITLPFIELAEDKKPWVAESYEESGTFFVKCTNGEYRIATVSLNDKSVFEAILPPVVANMLTERIVEAKFVHVMGTLYGSLEDIRGGIADCKDQEEGMTQRMDRLISEFTEEQDSVMEKLCSIQNGMCCRHEENPSSAKGFISEKALVQLVKEIKK